mgnify:FL=1
MADYRLTIIKGAIGMFDQGDIDETGLREILREISLKLDWIQIDMDGDFEVRIGDDKTGGIDLMCEKGEVDVMVNDLMPLRD